MEGKMKALLFPEPWIVKLIDVDIPKPSPNEVLAEIISVFEYYTKGSRGQRFLKGCWNRNHLRLAEKILDKARGKIDASEEEEEADAAVKEIISFIVLNPTSFRMAAPIV